MIHDISWYHIWELPEVHSCCGSAEVYQQPGLGPGVEPDGITADWNEQHPDTPERELRKLNRSGRTNRLSSIQSQAIDIYKIYS